MNCIRSLLIALAVLFLTAATEAVAQQVPNLVTIVVPYPVGGLGDIMPRAMADVLRTRTGRAFVIDNRPGATQMLGARMAAQSKPDGSVILFGSATSLVVNPAMKKSLPYDPVNDFEPISLVFIAPMYLLVRPDLPVKSVQDLVELAKSRPAALTYASGGVGSTSHLAGELLKTRAGIDLIHVPYAGTGPAVRDVIGGHVDLTFTGSGLSYVEQVRILAVSTATRSQAAPQIPAIAETVPGYDATGWFGFLAPARTPRAIVDWFATEMRQAVVSDALKERMEASGNELEFRASTPGEFRDYIAKEIPRWQAVIKAANIPLE